MIRQAMKHTEGFTFSGRIDLIPCSLQLKREDEPCLNVAS